MKDDEDKIIEYNDIDGLKKKLRGKTTILVGGCFDILHYGHVKFLKEAKKEADILIVALESDDFIQQRKKRKPFHTQDKRAFILSELESVDVVLNLPLLKTDEEYKQLVVSIKPTYIGVTKGDKYLEIKEKQTKEVGANVKVITSLIEGFSTNQILKYETILSD